MADKHALVSELKQIAADLGRPPLRREYLSESKSGHTFENAFGTYTEFLKAAGLEPKRIILSNPEKKFEREIVTQDFKDKLHLKFDEEISPFIGKFDRGRKDVFTLMYRSDDHAQWCDPFCDGVFKAIAKRLQPDFIVFGGDTNDFYQVSSHNKNPRRQMSLQSEINFTKTHFFEETRALCPDSQIDWLLGNHEMRLFRYLCDVAPALSSLDCLAFDKLFDLEKYRINLVARHSFLNPKATKDHENYKIYNEAFVVTHGTSTGQHPALAELLRYGMSGVSGHVHRHTYSARRNLTGLNQWVTSGAMCTLKSGEEYIPDLVNWQNGFVIVYVHRGKVYIENIDLSNDFACIGGVFYKRKDYGPSELHKSGLFL